MKKFKELFVNSFFYCLAIELVEEVLEDLIAYEISLLFLKGISTLVTVAVSYSAKLGIKTIVKKITYKEGNDKVEKLKKAFAWVRANKCTLGGIASGIVGVLSGTNIIPVNQLPALLIGSFNLTPFIYYGLLGIITIICSFFPETVEKFFARIKEKKAEKDAKAIEKEAKKEIAKDQKLANQTQAEQEKAQIKADAEAKAKEEKELAEKQHRAKVEEVKAKLLAQKSKDTQNA